MKRSSWGVFFSWFACVTHVSFTCCSNSCIFYYFYRCYSFTFFSSILYLRVFSFQLMNEWMNEWMNEYIVVWQRLIILFHSLVFTTIAYMWLVVGDAHFVASCVICVVTQFRSTTVWRWRSIATEPHLRDKSSAIPQRRHVDAATCRTDRCTWNVALTNRVVSTLQYVHYCSVTYCCDLFRPVLHVA